MLSRNRQAAAIGHCSGALVLVRCGLRTRRTASNQILHLVEPHRLGETQRATEGPSPDCLLEATGVWMQPGPSTRSHATNIRHNGNRSIPAAGPGIRDDPHQR